MKQLLSISINDYYLFLCNSIKQLLSISINDYY